MALVSGEDKSGDSVRIIIETLKFLHLSLCLSHSHAHIHTHACTCTDTKSSGNQPERIQLSTAGGNGIIYAYMHEYPASVRGSMLKGKIKKIIRYSNSYILCWSPQPK